MLVVKPFARAPKRQPHERHGSCQPEHGPHHYHHEWAQPQVLPRVDQGRLRMPGIIVDRERACPIGGAKADGLYVETERGESCMSASNGAYFGARRRYIRSVLRMVGISVALIFVIGILCAMA